MVVLRFPLRDPLYSRLTVSYWHWVTAVHFSLGNQNQSHRSVKCFPSLPVDTEGRRAQGGQVWQKHWVQWRHCIQNVYSSENKTFPLPWWKQFSVINPPPGMMYDHPGRWCHTGDSVLISAAGVLDTQPLWVEVHVSEPMYDLPPSQTTLFMSLLGSDRSGWGERLTGR